MFSFHDAQKNHIKQFFNAYLPQGRISVIVASMTYANRRSGQAAQALISKSKDVGRRRAACPAPRRTAIRKAMEHRANHGLVALRRILQATQVSARTLARETGLTVHQLVALEVMAEVGEATPTTIARRIGIAQATATALIEKLRLRGLVTRRRGESDKRQIWIALTEDGRALLEAAPDPLHQRFAARFDRLKDWEQAMLVASLERVADLLDAPEEEDAPVLHAAALDPAAGEYHSDG